MATIQKACSSKKALLKQRPCAEFDTCTRKRTCESPLGKDRGISLPSGPLQDLLRYRSLVQEAFLLISYRVRSPRKIQVPEEIRSFRAIVVPNFGGKARGTGCDMPSCLKTQGYARHSPGKPPRQSSGCKAISSSRWRYEFYSVKCGQAGRERKPRDRESRVGLLNGSKLLVLFVSA